MILRCVLTLLIFALLQPLAFGQELKQEVTVKKICTDGGIEIVEDNQESVDHWWTDPRTRVFKDGAESRLKLLPAREFKATLLWKYDREYRSNDGWRLLEIRTKLPPPPPVKKR